jgi:hypothetical protein
MNFSKVIPIMQINLHHSRKTTTSLCRSLSKKTQSYDDIADDIGLLQSGIEPATVRNIHSSASIEHDSYMV